MTTTKTKTFQQAFSDAYPYGKEAIAKVFFEFKSKFKLREAYKRKGVLFEFWQFWGETYCYTVILIDNKTCHFFEMGNTTGRSLDAWRKLVGFESYKYFNGCPHYTMHNASEVEIIKTEERFLEFHKIARLTEPGSPLKKQYTQIPGTPYMIGKPIMYRFKGDAKEFFYASGYHILSYDLEYNLANNYRFNTKFCVVSSNGGNGSPTQPLDQLIKDLEKEKEKYVKGYYAEWSTLPKGTENNWMEPNPEMEAKIQTKIEAVKQFKQTYKG